MPRLTTQVTDLTTGQAAEGMRVELWNLDGKPVQLKAITTNAEGRTETPLLDAATMAVGSYELVFFVKDYFVNHHKDSVFLDRVPVRFAIANPGGRYNVQLLVTPWGYNVHRS